MNILKNIVLLTCFSATTSCAANMTHDQSDIRLDYITKPETLPETIEEVSLGTYTTGKLTAKNGCLYTHSNFDEEKVLALLLWPEHAKLHNARISSSVTSALYQDVHIGQRIQLGGIIRKGDSLVPAYGPTVRRQCDTGYVQFVESWKPI